MLLEFSELLDKLVNLNHCRRAGMTFTITLNLLVQGKGKATISLVKLVNNNIAIMIANIYLLCSRHCAK